MVAGPPAGQGETNRTKFFKGWGNSKSLGGTKKKGVGKKRHIRESNQPKNFSGGTATKSQKGWGFLQGRNLLSPLKIWEESTGRETKKRFGEKKGGQQEEK